MARSTRLLCASLVVLAALASCQTAASSVASKEQQHVPAVAQQVSLASKLLAQPKVRSSRSLSDMFEKVKSRIFGNKKSSSSPAQASSSSSAVQSSLVQPATVSLNAANIQRQPWDMSAFGQQYNPYTSLAGSAGSQQQYQWPNAAGAGQYLATAGSSAQPQFAAYQGSLPGQLQSVGGLDAMSAQASASGQPSIPQVPANSAPAGGPGSGSGSGGLFSSASHLIAQYLSPSSSSSSSSSPISAALPQQQQTQNSLSPQQQQTQSQYQEFASILDSMVAQTNGNSGLPQQQRALQYTGQQQQQPQIGGIQQAASMPGQTNDQDVSGSSQIQSYLTSSGSAPSPASQASASISATPQQANQKSSMVSLAEQLAPGSQFNKLISFPFSLSSNDDPNKEGRYKLHIPFLNQHVKRSDSSAAAAASSQQQQQLAQQRAVQQQQVQQYLNNYYQQQQLYASQQQPTAQLQAQASQVIPSIAGSQLSAVQSAASSVQQQQSPVASSASQQQRPNWSVADNQSISSNSKLTPIQSVAAAAVAAPSSSSISSSSPSSPSSSSASSSSNSAPSSVSLESISQS